MSEPDAETFCGPLSAPIIKSSGRTKAITAILKKDGKSANVRCLFGGENRWPPRLPKRPHMGSFGGTPAGDAAGFRKADCCYRAHQESVHQALNLTPMARPGGSPWRTARRPLVLCRNLRRQRADHDPGFFEQAEADAVRKDV